ncbi:hypothetical protein AAF712_012803 [Marasmius tenuissimus]|uniref:Major facilitator superfamily (MFS) profile domain-containing protein n=1 Tax=Marasmius tenuissimus TaxID=585030 RepID=A0ABR2ZHL2_9AGAR|nr:hypothetical protein PM082_010927 [Marasmius tenuissimus]
MAASSRSSVTMLDTSVGTPTREPIDAPAALSMSLAREIERDENRITAYGGNDVRDPEPEPEEIPSMKEKNMVTWDGDDDPANPQNWSVARKWLITAVCITMCLSVSFASSAPASATARLIREFHINSETSYANVTVYLLGFMFGPVLWGPGSEIWGRQRILRATTVCFTLFHLGQALGKNIETYLITRFFCGFFGVAPLTVCGGVIVDIWPVLGRGLATSLFSATIFIGPVAGPIVGGYISQSNTVSWRWIIWIMMIFAGVGAFASWTLLPETYAPILLLRKAQRLRKQDPEGTRNLYAEHENTDFSIRGIIHRTIVRSFQMLAQEPILLLITIYMSLTYGVLYALFQALPLIFMKTRGFTIGQSGLIFIGVGIGTTLGSIINHLCSLHYPKLVQKWKGFPPPEQRLFGAMIGAPALVIGGFWLGWTGEYSSVHWAVPAVATVFIGMGISLIFISFFSFLVDTYLMYAASAFSANTVVRSLVGAAFPLFTTQMFNGMGINWACTLISLVALVLAPSPFLFYKYGPRIRSRSKFAPCIDLKIAEQLRSEASSHEKV